MNVRAVFASLALLLCGTGAFAQDYVLSSDGYYYSGGRAYTRTWYAGSSYCGRNGCYYSIPGYYQYVLAPQAVAVSNTTTTTTNNYPPVNWRSETIKAIAAKAEAVEYEHALQYLTGFQGYAYPGYANSLQLSTAGVQGSTVYGAQLRDFYADNSGAIISQAISRYLDKGPDLVHDAFGQAVTIQDAHDERMNATAQILAKGQALTALLAPPPSATKSQLTVTPVPIPSGTQQPATQPEVTVVPPAAVNGSDATVAWSQSAMRCVNCHANNGANRKVFDVTTFPSMTDQQAMNVVSRMTTKDLKLRMPRNPDGTVGPQVPPAEVAKWLLLPRTPAGK